MSRNLRMQVVRIGAVLLALSLWLGLATPSVLKDAWTAAAQALIPTP